MVYRGKKVFLINFSVLKAKNEVVSSVIFKKKKEGKKSILRKDAYQNQLYRV